MGTCLTLPQNQNQGQPAAGHQPMLQSRSARHSIRRILQKIFGLRLNCKMMNFRVLTDRVAHVSCQYEDLGIIFVWGGYNRDLGKQCLAYRWIRITDFVTQLSWTW